MVSIYIAGPDVFELDSIKIGQKFKKLCLMYNFNGLYPLDNEVDFNQKKEKIAQDIYGQNIKLINKADIIIANLNSFRGKEPDSGTVWECAYAFAKGKKVYGYLENKQSYINTFKEEETQIINYVKCDKDKRVIEDFNYPLNLMLSCSIYKTIEGSFEDVLKEIKDENSKK